MLVAAEEEVVAVVMHELVVEGAARVRRWALAHRVPHRVHPGHRPPLRGLLRHRGRRFRKLAGLALGRRQHRHRDHRWE